MPEGMCIRNNKFGKKAEANLAKTWYICQNFTSRRKQVMYNFGNDSLDFYFSEW